MFENLITLSLFQVVRLGELPHSVEPQLLNLGLIVELPAIPGTPLMIEGKVVDPLQTNHYTAKYRGRQYADSKTSISVGHSDSKVFFDSEYLNNKVDVSECSLI